MRRDRVGNAHFGLGVPVLREVARIHVHSRPGRTRLADDRDGGSRIRAEPAIIFHADEDSLRPRIFGRAFEDFRGPIDRLLLGNAFRNCAAEDAHVRGAQLIRHVDPLLRVFHFGGAQFGGRLAKAHAHGHAVKRDAVPVSRPPQICEELIGGIRKPVHRRVEALEAEIGGVADQVFIRHLLRRKRPAERIGHKTGP